MSIYRVPQSLVDDIWPAIESFVARSCETHPFLDAEDVKTLIHRGVVTLFIATQNGAVLGFGCLEVIEYPRRTVANVLGVGGRRGFLAVAINELAEAMIDYGESQGATVVALSGRPGWLRALKHLGANSRHFITMWADINGTRRRQRRINQADDHAGTVETGATLST